MKLIKKTRTPSAQLHRLAIIGIAVVVFAAGCPQSGDESSVGSGTAVPLSSRTASASSGLDAGGATTTQVPIHEQSPSSSAGTTTAATATAASEPLFAGEGSALSGRVVELVDFAVGVCADLYELRCARALWDVCMQLRIELSSVFVLSIDISTSEIIEIDDLRDDICSLFQMVQYWELYSILAAKYGENFYRPDTGFFLFRGELTSGTNPLLADPWTLRIFPRSCDDECRGDYDGTFESFRDITRFARYLPDDSRIGLLRFTFDMRIIFSNLHPSAVLISEDEADRILGIYESLEVDDECYTPLLVDFSRNNVGRGIVNECIADQCDNGHEKFFLGCYQCSAEYIEFLDCNPNGILQRNVSNTSIAIPDGGDVFQYISGSYYSKRLLFWEVLKYACATGEIHSDAYADDACRTVAHNICRIIRRDADNNNRLVGGSLGDDSFFALESVICYLGRSLARLPFESAKEACLRELEVLLTSENLFLASDGRCNQATQRCLEFRNQEFLTYSRSQEFSAYRHCGGFEQYFHVEIFWKNIPLHCAQDDSQTATFGSSECYKMIRAFCRNDINADRAYEYKRYEDEFENEDIPIRERIKISNVLCDALLKTYDPVANASISGNLSLLPKEPQALLIPVDFPIIIEPDTIDAEQTSTQLTRSNFDSIKSAVAVCAIGLSLPGDSECAIELWKSCFNLFYSKAKHESTESEVYRSSEYVCTAAWIAELSRMASVLSSSFPQDYQTRRFIYFSRYIADEASNGGILSINENGEARPNPNFEDLNPEAAEALTALATSLAQHIQPYLPTPNTVIQSSV